MIKELVHKQSLIESLTEVLELTRKCGEKGYEYYVRDLLAHLHKGDSTNLKKDMKYCNPRSWNMNGFKDLTDKKKLNLELANIERLMKKNKRRLPWELIEL